MTTLPPSTVYRGVAELAAREPQRTVLRADGESISAAALLERSNHVAGWLVGQGLVAGDRIAIWMPNSLDWVAIFLAASRQGLCVVSLNTRYKGEELSYMLSHSGARVLFTVPENGPTDNLAILAGLWQQAEFALPTVVLKGDGRGGFAAADFDRDVLPAATPAGAPLDNTESDQVILYTSGTTALPKAVVVSERALLAHAAMLPSWLKLTPESRILLVTPFCGIYGLNALIAFLLLGAVGVLTDSTDPELTLDLIEAERVNSVSGTVDTVLRRWDEAQRRRPRDLSSLKGGAAPVAWLNRDPLVEIPIFEASLGVRIVHAYGMSETASMIIVGDLDAPQDIRAVVCGWCISPLVKAKVVDPATGDAAAAGDIGRLYISGPTLLSRYFNNEPATRENLSDDGWFDTGDFARRYENGSIRYEGRSKDIIKIAGFSLSPAEVEQFLSRHPGIDRAQAVGFALPDGTEVLAAAVIARDGVELTAKAIADFCKGKVATYKIPSFIKLVTSFPTTSGANADKTQKNVLRDQLRREYLNNN